MALVLFKKNKKRKIDDENREFNKEWTDLYAFVRNQDGRSTCLICQDKLANNKKPNIETFLYKTQCICE